MGKNMPDDYDDDYNSERRRQKALERLGTNKPKCVFCNESNPHCLERHHIPGRGFGDEVVIVCRNCHRKLSNSQKGHSSKINDPPSLDERVEHFLDGGADFLVVLADSLRKYARELDERTRSNANGGPKPPP
jgi:hypothetical protein